MIADRLGVIVRVEPLAVFPEVRQHIALATADNRTTPVLSAGPFHLPSQVGVIFGYGSRPRNIGKWHWAIRHSRAERYRVSVVHLVGFLGSQTLIEFAFRLSAKASFGAGQQANGRSSSAVNEDRRAKPPSDAVARVSGIDRHDPLAVHHHALGMVLQKE